MKHHETPETYRHNDFGKYEKSHSSKQNIFELYGLCVKKTVTILKKKYVCNPPKWEPSSSGTLGSPVA